METVKVLGIDGKEYLIKLRSKLSLYEKTIALKKLAKNIDVNGLDKKYYDQFLSIASFLLFRDNPIKASFIEAGSFERDLLPVIEKILTRA
jgi:hypothetical protein